MNSYSKTEAAVAALTPEQFRVTQQNGTERRGTGPLLKNKQAGIYVDIVSGEPLFASTDKYESGCGWPSFTRPIDAANVKATRDWSMFIPRTEVRSAQGDSHLGHVFKDGPRDRGGLRYCINSAALRFVPRAEMAGQGYGDYLGQIEAPPATTQRAVLAGGCFWGIQRPLESVEFIGLNEVAVVVRETGRIVRVVHSSFLLSGHVQHILNTPTNMLRVTEVP